MDRRHFLQTGIAATIATGIPQKAFASTPPAKLNILFVFSDEHRVKSLQSTAGTSPANTVHSPNLSQFRAQNFSFSHCISNYPLCCPYRAILQTGQWPIQNGIIDNAHQITPITSPKPSTTTDQYLGDVFSAGGYKTAYIGKWHLSANGDSVYYPPGDENRLGYDEFDVWFNTDSHWASSKFIAGQPQVQNVYNPIGMTDDAVAYIKNNVHIDDTTKPWFLTVSWNPPHPPYSNPAAVPAGDTPCNAPQGTDLTPTAVVNGPPLSFQNTGLTYQGMTLAANAVVGPSGGTGLGCATALQLFQQGYYGHIAAIDNEFPRLLDALASTGQDATTVVIYTSDHGEMMGAQGYLAKRLPFEESCRVPFMVRWPGVTAAGSTSPMLFSAIDIFPTLCGIAGITPPAGQCGGNNYAKTIAGQSGGPAEPPYVLLINMDDSTTFGTVPLSRGLRTAPTPASGSTPGSHSYTYAVTTLGRWILYDNETDPLQMNNLMPILQANNSDPVSQGLLAMVQQFDKIIETYLRTIIGTASNPDVFNYSVHIKSFDTTNHTYNTINGYPGGAPTPPPLGTMFPNPPLPTAQTS